MNKIIDAIEDNEFYPEIFPLEMPYEELALALTMHLRNNGDIEEYELVTNVNITNKFNEEGNVELDVTVDYERE